jgi:hypothetical protein
LAQAVYHALAPNKASRIRGSASLSGLQQCTAMM